MGEELYELPKGWVWTSIKEIGEVITGTTPSKSDPEYYGRDFPFFKPTDLNKGYYVRQAEDGLSQKGILKARLIPEKSILVTCIGATISKTGFIRVQGSCNQQINAIVPNINLLPEFIYFWCISPIFKKTIIDNSSSTTLPILNKSKFEALSILLPPLAEQYRIVAKIEELFTQLDAGVELLKKVKAKLKRYRQAVLKAAVEGNLTKEWREANQGKLEPASVLLERILKQRREKWEAEQLAKMKAQGKTPKDDSWKLKYKEPVAPDISDLPDLPDGWCWAKIEQLGRVQGGRQRAPRHHTGEHMRPYLRPANVFENRIDTSSILEMNFTPEEFKIYELKYGDILLNEGQSLELVGRPAIYRNELPGACFQNTLVRFQPYDGLIREFALYVFLAYLHNGRFQKIARWTTNIAHLGSTRFAELEFPLPSINEERFIVTEIARITSIIDQLEKTINVNLKRAEKLRQTILKQAFEGKLVPQDPNDEPAEKLLERIKAEKANREADKKPKRQSTIKSKQPRKSKTTATQLELKLDD